LGVAGADRGFRPGSAMAASGDLGGSEKCGAGAEERANADEDEEEGAAAMSSFSLDSAAAAGARRAREVEARRPPALAPGAAIAVVGESMSGRSEVAREREWGAGWSGAVGLRSDSNLNCGCVP
jgi:hypothetical protein